MYTPIVVVASDVQLNNWCQATQTDKCEIKVFRETTNSEFMRGLHIKTPVILLDGTHDFQITHELIERFPNVKHMTDQTISDAEKVWRGEE